MLAEPMASIVQVFRAAGNMLHEFHEHVPCARIIAEGRRTATHFALVKHLAHDEGTRELRPGSSQPSLAAGAVTQGRDFRAGGQSRCG